MKNEAQSANRTPLYIRAPISRDPGTVKDFVVYPTAVIK